MIYHHIRFKFRERKGENLSNLAKETNPVTNSRMKVKQHRKTSSWSLLTDSFTMADKDHPRRSTINGVRSVHFSFGQALTLAAMCSSAVAVCTALVAAYSFSSSLTDYYSDKLVASTTRSIIQRTRLRPVPTHEQEPTRLVEETAVPDSEEEESALPVEEEETPTESVANADESTELTVDDGDVNTSAEDDEEMTDDVEDDEGQDSILTGDDAPTQETQWDGETRFPMSILTPMVEKNTGPFPHIAWLMSFPNSGTSFTLHMTREASNCTTATNYALEGAIKDKPSVPAIEGPDGLQGPFLEVIPGRFTNLPTTILTKTHW